MTQVEELVDFAIDLARDAGKIMMNGLGHTTIAKKSWRDLVTEVDEACERHVVTMLKVTYPDHDYFAEEGHEKREKKSEWRWIIDPVDGTTNFAHSLPLFSISIGIERAGECVGGVVFAPYLNELFFGWKGGGAYLNTKSIPIHVSEREPISDCVLATGFSYVQHKSANENLDNWARITREARGTRRFGSAALDLAYVAAGRLDGFWEMHLKPYDVAAGVVLIREAGGRVTDFFGGEDWLEGQSIVATNGKIHEALRSRLDPVQPDGFVRIPGEKKP